MLKSLMKEVNSMWDQLSNFRKEIETIRKNQLQMLEVKIKITKFENIFYISMMKLDTSTETIRELQDHLMVDQ
jgi:TolA-binding protein